MIQFWSLFYLVSLFSVVTARVAAVQRVLDSVSGLDAKVDSLCTGIDAILQSKETASVTRALSLQKETMGLIDAVNEVARTARMCPEFDFEESTTILDMFHNMLPKVDAALKLVVNKKSLIDNLHGGRITALVGLSLIQLKECLIKLHDAFMDKAHIDRLPEALIIMNHAHHAYDYAIAAYTN